MKRELILIVDDDPDCRTTLEIVVQCNGFSVVSASNGGEALQVAVQAQPALIFMDLMMPVMDGYQTTEAIRERLGSSGTYIVAVSAVSDAASREAAFKAGVNDFLAKPWNTSDIRRILQTVCPIPEHHRVTAA
jgi:CheY-like chemotaxis protein